MQKIKTKGMDTVTPIALKKSPPPPSSYQNYFNQISHVHFSISSLL